MSKKIPVTGDELKAFEEQQNRVKQETLKVASVVSDESAAPLSGASPAPVVATAAEPIKSKEGKGNFFQTQVKMLIILHVNTAKVSRDA